MRSILERQFRLAVPLIFTVLLLVPQRAALFLTSLSTVLHSWPLLWWVLLLVLNILLKKKYRKRVGGITVLQEVTVMEGCLMEGYASIEPFGIAISVIGSTRRPTTVKNLAMAALQHILTPSFITVDIFALAVPYLFAVCFIHNNDDCLYQNLAAMITVVHIRLYKRHDMS